MQSSTKENWVNWVNGVKENGANFQPKEHGANFQPKEMPNYLEGGVRGEPGKRPQNTIGNTNEYKRILKTHIYIYIYNLYLY